MANIVILTHWTGGDVYPFIRIGRRLHQRGHAVTLITHCVYESAVREAGITFAALDTPEEWANFLQEDMQRMTELMDNLRNIAQAAQQHAQENLQLVTYEQLHREYELVKQYCHVPDTILVARHGSGSAALLVAEELDLPIVSVFLAPAMAVQTLIDEALIGELLLADFNDIRAKLGFRPIRSWLAWVNAAHRNLGLWPEWFAASEPGWQIEITPVGFPLDREAVADINELPPEIQDMLRRGERPVLISGGTGKIVRSGFYAVCVEACRLLGCSAILASQYPELVPDGLPDQIKWVRYLPFEKIMPFMGTIIHHGGIGTLSQALLAGVPQLVLAHGMDRPDNATRLKQVGGGEALMFAKWKPEPVAAALQSLMAPEVREHCATLARRVNEHDALGQAAEAIERAVYDREAHLSGADFLAQPGSSSQSRAGAAPAHSEQAIAFAAAASTNGAARPVADKLSKLSPEQLALLMRRLQKKNERG